jgi:hypothetical protein
MSRFNYDEMIQFIQFNDLDVRMQRKNGKECYVTTKKNSSWILGEFVGGPVEGYEFTLNPDKNSEEKA